MGKPRKTKRPDDDGPVTAGTYPAVDIAGPHQIPQENRTQTAVSGPPLHLGSARSVLLIRDNDTARWAIYPGGDPREAFWVPAEEMLTAACRVLAAETARLDVHLKSAGPSPVDAITPEDLS